jgi:prophage antirepressor-like protein
LSTDRHVAAGDGSPWWVLAAVCKVLEIENPRNVAARLDEDEKDTVQTMDGQGGPDRTIISEPGLYKLIQTSRKPAAKRFDRWVRHEVLPVVNSRDVALHFEKRHDNVLRDIGDLLKSEGVDPLWLRPTPPPKSG